MQLHHIDGDHSNSVADNLAVLCLECHYQTQVSGGFSRHLDAAQVRHHRTDWLERVRRRRDDADRLSTEVMASVSTATATPSTPTANATTLEASVVEAVGIIEGASTVLGVGRAIVPPAIPLWDYVRTLPELKRRAYATARPEWDTGVTARMVEASYGVVDVMQDILANLATRYPEGHFETPDPRDYISQVISSRYRWHRYHHEPNGRGQDGTIVHPMVAGSVINDVERMIVEMVTSLTLDWSSTRNYDFERWQNEWNQAGR